MNRKILAFDMDGTLTKGGQGGWNDELCLKAEPNHKMIELCNQAWDKGHFILIYSARRWSRREATEYWLKKHDVKYHALDLGNKPAFDILIDDRAINARDLKKIKSVL
jgi:hydroxymethylpyrimidine pyrophosphatase-like HAD family hydrolase